MAKGSSATPSDTSASAPKKAGDKHVVGRPFPKGHTGRPKGALNRTTRALQELLDGEGDKLTRKCIDRALAGNLGALRICMDRLIPARRDAPIEFDLPDITSVADLPNATNAILKAVATGELTPSEAAIVNTSVSAHQRSLEMREIEARLRLLEEKLGDG